MKNLTKREIVINISEKTGLIQQDVHQIIQLVLGQIIDAVAEGRNVELRNFGVFEVKVRKPRVGRNPHKPENDVLIPARAVVKFKAGKEMKVQVLKLSPKASSSKRQELVGA